jgi:hypothetical protein
MKARRAKVLLVDDSQGFLSAALAGALSGCEIEIARDAFDAIYRVDCADRPHDAIFCDVSRSDIPAPELFSYLSLTRSEAAQRMIFVASGPLEPETRAFLDRVRRPLVALPAAPEALEALWSGPVAADGARGDARGGSGDAESDVRRVAGSSA